MATFRTSSFNSFQSSAEMPADLTAVHMVYVVPTSQQHTAQSAQHCTCMNDLQG